MRCLTYYKRCSECRHCSQETSEGCRCGGMRYVFDRRADSPKDGGIWSDQKRDDGKGD